MNLTWLYVGALYAIAVWLVRRGGNDLRWRIAALFYLLVLVFLFRPMTQQYVNYPVDIVEKLPPWSNVVPRHPVSNFEMNDIVMQIVPWAHQTREAWRSLSLPLWNALAGGGYPLMANAQSSAFAPVRLLALPLPLGFAMTAEAAMKILIALTFMFLYGRRRGWGELPSAIAAICFGWCTFVQTWLHFPLVTVSCLIPAIFLMTDMLFERVTWPRFLVACGVWAAMLFGGHPETCSHAFFVMMLYVAWIALVERPLRWRATGFAAAAVIGTVAVGALIAAPFIAPFAEALTKSMRYQELQAHPNEIGYYSDLPSEIVLFSPHIYGFMPHEKPWNTAPAAESITGFAGVLGIASWFALLIRAIVRRRFREREVFYVIGTLIVLGIILAWPGVSDAFHLIFKLAANARLRLFLCWFVAVMTGAALDAVLRERNAAPLLAGCAVVAAMMWWIVNRSFFPTDWDLSTGVMALLPSMIVILLATLFAVPQRFRPIATMIVAAAIVGELWSASEGWNPVIEAERSYPVTPLIAKLQQLQSRNWSHAPFRVVGLGASFFPNINAIYGIEDIRAHDPMANGRYLGFLRVASKYEPDDYFAKWNDPDTPIVNFLNVRYVITEKRYEMKDLQRYREVYSGKDGRIYENRDVLPRFFPVRNVVLQFKGDEFVRTLMTHRDWNITGLVKILPVNGDKMRRDLLAPRPLNSPEASLRITEAHLTDFRMHVSAPRYSLIVSSIAWWPGWRVTQNGKAIEPQPVNGPFLGFTVPPGETDIHVWYSPLTFWLGATCSILTMMLLAGLAWRSSRRRGRVAAAAE